jgi:hypothetical protein
MTYAPVNQQATTVLEHVQAFHATTPVMLHELDMERELRQRSVHQPSASDVIAGFVAGGAAATRSTGAMIWKDGSSLVCTPIRRS